MRCGIVRQPIYCTKETLRRQVGSGYKILTENLRFTKVLLCRMKNLGEKGKMGLTLFFSADTV